MTLNRLLSTIYYIGMIVLLTGIILHISDLAIAFYVYVAGLIPVLGIRLYNFIIGSPENKRKHAILVFSALALAGAGVAIYMDRSYWVVLIAVSAVLDFYLSFRKL